MPDPASWRWGAGPPQVLALHCTLAHGGVWGGVMRALGLPGFAPDLPGHGGRPDWDRSRDYADQCLDAALACLPDYPVDVIGHSFGAVVALRLAMERPGAVWRLVLVEPVLFAAVRGTPEFDRNLADFAPYASALQDGKSRLAVQRFTDVWGAGVAWDNLRDGQRQTLSEQIHIVPAQDSALFQDKAGLLDRGRLEALNLPVLLMEGAASPPIIGAINGALQARLRDASRLCIPEAGHMAPITHPGPVAETIAAFLSR